LILSNKPRKCLSYFTKKLPFDNTTITNKSLIYNNIFIKPGGKMKLAFILAIISLLLTSCSFFNISGEMIEKEKTDEQFTIDTNMLESKQTSSLFTDDCWPMFRHDPVHSGYSTSYGPETNSIKWFYNSGSWIRSSPAVVDGKIYFANYDSNVFCLDIYSGELIWKTNIGYEWLYSSPAVVDEKLFIGSDDDNVYCLDALTGEILWKFHTSTLSRVDSSPTVVNGKVFIGSNDGKLYCINSHNGKEIWNFNAGNDDKIYSSPAVVDAKVYFGTNKGKFYCIDENSGTQIWKKVFSVAVDSSPSVANGRVYVGSDSGFLCLDATDGDALWKYGNSRFLESSPAVVDMYVYIGTWKYVHCLNANSGDLIWKTMVDKKMCSSPAVVDGILYVGSENTNAGHLTCLNANTGEKIWDYTTDGWVWSSPAVVDGMVFLGCCDSKMYCFGDNYNGNQAPEPPIINGPSEVKKNTEYEYTFTLTDPDGDDVYVYIDWRAEYGLLPMWRGPYPSGYELTLSRSYDDREKIYTVKARTRDSSLSQSDWETLDVKVSGVKTKNSPFFERLNNNPLLFNLFQKIFYFGVQFNHN